MSAAQRMVRAHQREALLPHQSGRVMTPALKGRRPFSQPVSVHIVAIVVPAMTDAKNTTGAKTII